MEKKRIHQDVFVGFFCLALCLLIYLLNSSLPADAAMMPKLLDGMLVVLSILIIYQGLRKSRLPAEERGKGMTWDDPGHRRGIPAHHVLCLCPIAEREY